MYSWILILTTTIFMFSALTLATLSGIFSERVGITNIAVNGFMIFGAAMYALISFLMTDVIFKGKTLSPWFQLLYFAFAGILSSGFALLFGFATIKLKSDQSVSGFAMNILAVGVASILLLFVKKAQQGGDYFQMRGQTELALSPNVDNWKNIISLKLFLALIIAGGSWFFLNKTKWGLRYKAIGENPQAADVAGINVFKYKWLGIAYSGFVAGLAGAVFIQCKTNQFSLYIEVGGLGFLALAIMITSGWKISWTLLICIIFSFIYGFSYFGISWLERFESMKGVSRFAELLYTLPFIITLGIMIAKMKSKQMGPAAAGRPYDKSER